jgi:hypothetical protein
MWPDFVVVSTPILHFLPGVVKAQEPVRVQAFVSELAIEGFDEAVVRGLARPGEVENDTALIGPQIEIARDELGALINANAFGVSLVDVNAAGVDAGERLQSADDGTERRGINSCRGAIKLSGCPPYWAYYSLPETLIFRVVK